MSSTLRERRTALSRLVTPMLLAALVLMAGVTVTTVAPTRAAAASNASTEESFVSLLNQYRAAHGLHALSVSAGARSVARGWSSTMADADRLYHNPNMVDQLAHVATDYRIVGENVGYGWSVGSLHDAFVNSPPHRENMLESRYDYVGIGVSQVGSKIWVAVDFIGTPQHLAGVSGSSSPARSAAAKTVHRALPGATSAGPTPLGTQLFTQVSGGATTVHGYSNGKITSTVNLGGRSLSAPAPARYGSAQAVAVRGTDNGVWIRSGSSGKWGPWHSIGGKTVHRPAMIGTGTGKLVVMVQGADRALWTKTYMPGRGWGGWSRVGGVITKGVQATGVGANIVVTGVGRDYAVYVRSLTARGWTSWHRAGGKTSSAAAVISRNGKPLLVVRGTDNHLYYAQLSAPTATAHWVSLGGVTNAGPGLGSYQGVISLAVRGADNNVWTRRLSSSWSRWARS